VVVECLDYVVHQILSSSIPLQLLGGGDGAAGVGVGLTLCYPSCEQVALSPGRLISDFGGANEDFVVVPSDEDDNNGMMGCRC
jgi:hypothetical protein